MTRNSRLETLPGNPQKKKFTLRPPHPTLTRFLLLALFCLLCTVTACSFDYGPGVSEDSGQPDIVMDNVEYVRVRNGDPKARFTAEHASRYEDKQIMELENLSFEQFESHGDDVNALGKAGTASVELESGNISMDGGVRIDVESEDYTIETKGIEWQDKERLLSSGANEVTIKRSDGTGFTGSGFSADVRNRTWSFNSGVSGTYVHEDDEEDGKTAEKTETEAPG
jgi:LPS export ABC transporter protein LptC